MFNNNGEFASYIIIGLSIAISCNRILDKNLSGLKWGKWEEPSTKTAYLLVKDLHLETINSSRLGNSYDLENSSKKLSWIMLLLNIINFLKKLKFLFCVRKLKSVILFLSFLS